MDHAADGAGNPRLIGTSTPVAIVVAIALVLTFAPLQANAEDP